MLNIPQDLGRRSRRRRERVASFWLSRFHFAGRLLLLLVARSYWRSVQGFTLRLLGNNTGSLYVFNILICQEAFQNLRFGTATAAALLQFVFILLISIFKSACSVKISPY